MLNADHLRAISEFEPLNAVSKTSVLLSRNIRDQVVVRFSLAESIEYLVNDNFRTRQNIRALLPESNLILAFVLRDTAPTEESFVIRWHHVQILQSVSTLRINARTMGPTVLNQLRLLSSVNTGKVHLDLTGTNLINFPSAIYMNSSVATLILDYAKLPQLDKIVPEHALKNLEVLSVIRTNVTSLRGLRYSNNLRVVNLTQCTEFTSMASLCGPSQRGAPWFPDLHIVNISGSSVTVIDGRITANLCYLDITGTEIESLIPILQRTNLQVLGFKMMIRNNL